MGQSNFNKSAIKAKENGANEKSKLDTPYRVVLGIIAALLVAFIVFAILVSARVINCTNTSTLIAEGVNGECVYYTYKTNAEGTGYEDVYYVIDENGKRIDCFFSETLNDVCYIDEEGNEQLYMVGYGEVGEGVDGSTLYMESSVNGLYGYGAVKYYFFDAAGQRVDCELSEDGTQIFYTNAAGEKVEYIFAVTSGSDVSASDVSSSDVSTADAAA